MIEMGNSSCGTCFGVAVEDLTLDGLPELADALLLLSYPLHPPRKPAELRTAHFPKLRTSSLIIHGSRDPFATTHEIKNAVALIPAHVNLLEIEGAGHDLGKNHSELAARIVQAFLGDSRLQARP